MAKTAAPKEIIKALALLAHAAQQEQAMHLGTARTRQEPRSTGQAYAARVGICAHILNVRGKWAVQLEVQRIELWTYSRSLLTSAGAPLRVLSGGCPYSAREFAKTYW